MALLPPAPTLPGEARLEIFVYPEALILNRALEENNKFSDANRLEVLGGKMTDLAYTDVLRSRWPRANAQQLKAPLQRFHTMHVPPAPQLPSEAHLEVFIHPDGPFHSPSVDPTNKFSNADRRLEELGRKMVDLAYMDVMFTEWPRSIADELHPLVSVTSNGFMERAVATYGWKGQIRASPPNVDIQSPELMINVQESIRIFRTYAGAVHIAHGYEVLRDWIRALTTI
ncbi:hypothetical protein BC628DRAFT_1445775 [Trametes gibbosa]|nr:hypothetical protein BC628DRAFT_1445775 [Trametes gibbosa]